jgi:hypothetical protein
MDPVAEFTRVVRRRADMARQLFGCRTDAEVLRYVWSRPRGQELARHPEVRRALPVDEHRHGSEFVAAVLARNHSPK